MEELVVSGATLQEDMAKITLVGVDNKPGNAAKIFSHLAKEKVVVNDIIQTEVSTEKANVSFTIGSSDLRAAERAVNKIKDKVHCESVFTREDIAEISVVGIGMRTHYGVADRLFSSLAKAKVNIDSITTSEIRISCIVDKAQGKKALITVCKAFDLDKPAAKRIKTSK
jgi:aspartate kinase